MKFTVNRTELLAAAQNAERIAAIKVMHKLLYRQGKTLAEARAAIAQLGDSSPEAAADVALMDGFLSQATNGIAR